MAAVTHDARSSWALLLALGSAMSFGLAGPLARGLLEAGWTPGAVVLVRIGLAALVVLPVALRALDRRWHLLRSNAGLLLFYGVLPVGAAQFGYFSAVAKMDVGPALLIEYTAPAALVAWVWLRHGTRPDRLTVTGAVLATIGLVLVLNLVSGTSLAPAGVAWALVAMVGAATYYVLSAGSETGLPTVTLAGGGLLVGAIVLALLGVVGLLPLHATTSQAVYAGGPVPWWIPVVALGGFTAMAYPLGIAASRGLGSRVASFVGLIEVVAGVLFAWALLDQLPGVLQLVGGVFILAGVIVVRMGGKPELPALDAGPELGPLASAVAEAA